jgi:hypothetical protein
MDLRPMPMRPWPSTSTLGLPPLILPLAGPRCPFSDSFDNGTPTLLQVQRVTHVLMTGFRGAGGREPTRPREGLRNELQQGALLLQ